MLLLFCPGLGFVEHGDVAADLQVVAVEPDGTLVGLAVLDHGVGSSDHFNIRRKDKPFYSYFQIFLVNLNLSRMPQVPVPLTRFIQTIPPL